MNDLVASIDNRLNERLKHIDKMDEILSQKLKRHEIVMLLGQSEMQQMKQQQEFQFSLLEDVIWDQRDKLGSTDPVVNRIRNKLIKG